MSTISGHLKKMNNQLVIRRVINMPCIEDIPELKARIEAALKESFTQGEFTDGTEVPKLIDKDTHWVVEGTNQTFLKPKQPREQLGFFEVRSADTVFTPIEGGKPIYGTKGGLIPDSEICMVSNLLNAERQEIISYQLVTEDPVPGDSTYVSSANLGRPKKEAQS